MEDLRGNKNAVLWEFSVTSGAGSVFSQWSVEVFMRFREEPRAPTEPWRNFCVYFPARERLICDCPAFIYIYSWRMNILSSVRKSWYSFVRGIVNFPVFRGKQGWILNKKRFFLCLLWAVAAAGRNCKSHVRRAKEEKAIKSCCLLVGATRIKNVGKYICSLWHFAWRAGNWHHWNALPHSISGFAFPSIMEIIMCGGFVTEDVNSLQWFQLQLSSWMKNNFYCKKDLQSKSTSRIQQPLVGLL